jgi:hypothetical protein
MMPSWATARHSGLPPTASEIPSCRLGLAGSIAVITRIDAKALAGLALAQRQQRAQGLADGGVGVLREDDAPAGLGEVLRVDALADAEVLGVLVALLVAQLAQVLKPSLAADEAGEVRGRHRRQGVVAGVAVDAVEVEQVVVAGLRVAGHGEIRLAGVWLLCLGVFPRLGDDVCCPFITYPHPGRTQVSDSYGDVVQQPQAFDFQQDSERSCHPLSGGAGDATREHVVEDQQAGGMLQAECDGLGFTGPEVGDQGHELGMAHLFWREPLDIRQVGDGDTQCCSRLKLGQYCGRNADLPIDPPQQVESSRLMQVQQRRGVADGGHVRRSRCPLSILQGSSRRGTPGSHPSALERRHAGCRRAGPRGRRIDDRAQTA